MALVGPSVILVPCGFFNHIIHKINIKRYQKKQIKLGGGFFKTPIANKSNEPPPAHRKGGKIIRHEAIHTGILYTHNYSVLQASIIQYSILQSIFFQFISSQFTIVIHFIMSNENLRLFKSSISSPVPRKKLKHTILHTASVRIQTHTIPLISSITRLPVNLISLHPHRPCTIGRKLSRCDFVFEDRRVSKKHFQIVFDAIRSKIFISDGESVGSCGKWCRDNVRVSLNGVFVNGIRVGRGEGVEVRAGDEVSVVCGNEGGGCSVGRRIGFVVERVAVVEEVVDGNVCGFREGIGSRGDVLLRKCREMLKEDLVLCDQKTRSRFLCRDVENDNSEYMLSDVGENPVTGSAQLRDGAGDCMEVLLRGNDMFIDNEFKSNLDGGGQLNKDILYVGVNCETECCEVIGNNSQKMNKGEAAVDSFLSNYSQKTSSRFIVHLKDTLLVSEVEGDPDCPTLNEGLQKMEAPRVHSENGMANGKPANISVGCEVEMDDPVTDCILENNSKDFSVPPPGKKFYLNRLHFMSHGSSEHENVVSLPDLLYPVKTIVRLFITTFTSNISW